MTTDTQVLVTTTDVFPGRSITDIFGPLIGVAFCAYTLQPTEEKSWLGATKTRPFEPQDTVNARSQALQNMLDVAIEVGADAIVGVRFDSSIVQSSYPFGDPKSFLNSKSADIWWGQHWVEYTAYGTAVKLD